MAFWFFKRKEEKDSKEIEEKLKNSFKNIREDIGNLNDWVDHFKNKHEKHDGKFEHVLKRLEILENQFLGHVKDEGLHAEKEGDFERVQSFNRSNQSFMNVQSDNLDIQLDNLKNLTPAQKRILLLMMGSGGPLGYEEIANKLKLSIVTARRHVNDILRGGVPLRQKMSVKNRRKMFQIDPNLRVLLENKRENKIKVRRKR